MNGIRTDKAIRLLRQTGKPNLTRVAIGLIKQRYAQVDPADSVRLLNADYASRKFPQSDHVRHGTSR